MRADEHDPITHVPEPEPQLAMIEQDAAYLADPSPAVENIAASLDYLYNTGASPDALIAIQDNAAYLVETIQQHNQALQGALALARKIREQRDQTRQVLDELRHALDEIDTSVPEVEQLYEYVTEEAEMGILEMMWEYLGDHIMMASPLEYYEANELLDILTGDVIDEASPLWADLRDWMKRAVQEAEGSAR